MVADVCLLIFCSEFIWACFCCVFGVGNAEFGVYC